MAKSDSAKIRQFLSQLAAEPWLGPSRADWPRHAYHITDVRNAAKILKCGALHSRAALNAAGSSFQDCADQAVIANSVWSHGYVRLYFRPRTPTQYRMEGISPPSARKHGAHVPVPVFLLFDAAQLFCEDGIEFSNGNVAASGHQRGGDAAFLESLNFKKIYHDGPIPESGKSEIVFMRCAEILMPGTLTFEHLRDVVCRTPPERDTLLALLGRDLEQVWRSRIRVEKAGENLFERRWYYVRDIRWDGKTIYIKHSMLPAVRRLKVRFRDGEIRTFSAPARSVGTQAEYNLVSSDSRIAVEYTVEDSLAYLGYLSQRQLFAL